MTEISSRSPEGMLMPDHIDAVDLRGLDPGAIEAPPPVPDPVPWWDRSWGRAVLRIIPGVVGLVGWQLLALALDSNLLPTATATIGSIGDLLTDSKVWSAFLISNRTLVVGFATSVLIGVPLGLLIGRVRIAARLIDVWLDLLIITPMAAVIPLIIMALGLGLVAQGFVLVCFALPMVAINATAGVRECPQDLIDMARCFGAKEHQIWRRVLLPSASPAIWAGLRIGLGRAILGMVIVELLMVALGIGLLLQRYRAAFETEHLYGVIILVVAESIALISLMKMLESRLAPWTRSDATH